MTTPTKTAIAAAVLLLAGLAAGWALSTWRSTAAHDGPAAAAVAPAAPAAERKVLYWYDPMMPTQKFDKPGKSPFMDMQLVARYADEGATDAETRPGISISPQAQQSLGVRVAVAEKRALASVVEAVGTVTLNERDVSIVQSRASGFVERVYGRAPGDVVDAGAPLVDVLLPEWLAAQQAAGRPAVRFADIPLETVTTSMTIRKSRSDRSSIISMPDVPPSITCTFQGTL